LNYKKTPQKRPAGGPKGRKRYPYWEERGFHSKDLKKCFLTVWTAKGPEGGKASCSFLIEVEEMRFAPRLPGLAKMPGRN